MAQADKDAPTVMQPGQVITPGSAPQSAEVPATLPIAASPPPAPSPAPVAVKADPPAPVPQVAKPAPVSPPEVAPVEPPQEGPSMADDESGVSWTASEFVAHEKSSNWYLSLATVAVLLSTAIFLVTRDAVSSVVVIVAALIMGVYGARKPKQLVYRLDEGGIGIGQKYFPYETFRSFSIMPEGAFSSIVLMPLKRFSPLITIYFAPDDEDTIATILSDRLPYAEFRYDAVDRLMKRIRF